MNKRAPLERNKLSSLILKSIEHEHLREIDSTSFINKFAVETLEITILSSRFAAFVNQLRHILRLHCLDIATIKFLDESRSII